MKSRMRIAALLLCLPSGECVAQQWEDLLGERETGELAELVRHVVTEPIDLNLLRREDISRLWFLDLSQKAALAVLIGRRAPQITIADVADHLGMSRAVARLLFRERGSSRSIQVRFRRSQEGWQQLIRAGVRKGVLKTGFLLERDAGEPRLDDFAAAFAVLEDRIRSRQLVAGQFIVLSGLGLVFAGPYGRPGAGSPARAFTPVPQKLVAYRAVAENVGFQGLAASARLRRLTILGFRSNARRDANRNSAGEISSLPESGLHRSLSEQANRNSASERAHGLSVAVPLHARLRVYGHHLSYGFDAPVAVQDSIRNRFAFRGASNRVHGIGLHWVGAAKVAAEVAKDRAGTAAIATLTRSSVAGELVAAFWTAAPGFRNRYGSLPGRSSSNQTGMYLAAAGRLAGGRISVYALHTRSRWRTFSLPRPTVSSRMRAQWTGAAVRNLHLRLRVEIRRQAATALSDSLPDQQSGQILTARTRLIANGQLRSRAGPDIMYEIRVHAELDRSSGTRGVVQRQVVRYRGARLGAAVDWFAYANRNRDAISQYVYHGPGLLRYVPLRGSGRYGAVRIDYRAGRRVRLSVYASLHARESGIQSREFGIQLQL